MEQLLPRARPKSKIAELLQQISFVWVEPAHEFGILQLLLALFGTHSAEHAEPAHQKLLAVLRQFLPARRKVGDDFPALLRRHALENSLTIAHRVALLRWHLIPALEIPAYLLLPLRWQIPETRVVAHKTLLLFRRTIPQFLDPLRRQTHHGARIRLARRPSGPLLGALHLALLLLSLTLHARTLASLPAESSSRWGGKSQARDEKQRRKARSELEESSHHDS